MRPKQAQFDHLLYQALQSPDGLVLSTNDPDRLRMALYSSRVRLNIPELARLEFKLTSSEAFGPDPVLIIVKLDHEAKRSSRRPTGAASSSADVESIVESFINF